MKKQVEMTVNLHGREVPAIVDGRQNTENVFNVPSEEVTGTGAAYDLLCALEVPPGSAAVVTQVFLRHAGAGDGAYFKLGKCTANSVAALAAATDALILGKESNGQIPGVEFPNGFIVDNRAGAASLWILLGFGGTIAGVACNAVTEFAIASMQGYLEAA